MIPFSSRKACNARNWLAGLRLFLPCKFVRSSLKSVRCEYLNISRRVQFNSDRVNLVTVLSSLFLRQLETNRAQNANDLSILVKVEQVSMSLQIISSDDDDRCVCTLQLGIASLLRFPRLHNHSQ